MTQNACPRCGNPLCIYCDEGSNYKAHQEAEKLCEHVYNTHGICQHCKHWDVQFDVRVTHLPLQTAVDTNGAVWQLGERVYPCDPKTDEWHLDKWPSTGLPIVELKVDSKYGLGVGFCFGDGEPYPSFRKENSERIFWGSNHFRKQRPSDPVPPPASAFYGGSVEFFRDGTTKVKAGSDRISAYPGDERMKEPLQTRLQKFAILCRTHPDRPIGHQHRIEVAALLEEAIAEIQLLQEIHATVLNLLTPKK